MTPEGLRARGERLHQELGRESYVTGAGLAAEVLGCPLDFGPLAASCEAGLA